MSCFDGFLNHQLCNKKCLPCWIQWITPRLWPFLVNLCIYFDPAVVDIRFKSSEHHLRLWQFICRMVPSLPPFHCHQQKVVDMALAVNISRCKGIATLHFLDLFAFRAMGNPKPTGISWGPALAFVRWSLVQMNLSGAGRMFVLPGFWSSSGATYLGRGHGVRWKEEGPRWWNQVFQNEVPWNSFWVWREVLGVVQPCLSQNVILYSISISKKRNMVRLIAYSLQGFISVRWSYPSRDWTSVPEKLRGCMFLRSRSN